MQRKWCCQNCGQMEQFVKTAGGGWGVGVETGVQKRDQKKKTQKRKKVINKSNIQTVSSTASYMFPCLISALVSPSVSASFQFASDPRSLLFILFMKSLLFVNEKYPKEYFKPKCIN